MVTALIICLVPNLHFCPNGWACLHYIVIHGLLRYGYCTEALRIAKKYVALADDVFQKTGHLWEKYNVVTGEVSTAKEYDTPAMMGWSAGVYLDCLSLMDSSDLYPQPQL